MSAAEQQDDLFGISKGEQMWKDAIAWKYENFRAYQYMLKTARADARAERHVSVSRYAEDIRRYGLLDKPEIPFELNNTKRAALARLMVQDAPEIEPYIDMRASAVDAFLGVVRH